MKHGILVLVGVLGLLIGADAQITLQPKQINNNGKGIVYDRELAVDFRLLQNGYALGITQGRLKTYYLTNLLQVELGELRHHKETRLGLDQSRPISTTIARPFRYGKQNNFYTARLSYGQKRYFTEKAKEKGVSLGLSYTGGVTLGILKPYYLEVFTQDRATANTRSLRYNEAEQDLFLDINSIHGASNWTRGLNEITPVPGINGKIAIHVDWGAFDEYIKAVEAGLMFDIFLQDVDIMADIDGVENRPYFFNLFLNLQLGKRR